MAEAHSQKIALILDNQAWTYAELIEKVECVVRHLHSAKVVEGQIIYQFVERGLEMICGILGILCTGGAYFPINPTEPSDRLIGMLEQTKGRYVLVQRKIYVRFPTKIVQHVGVLDDILVPVSYSYNKHELFTCREYGAAFVLCTSGTTGRPKPIVHTHKSLSTANYIYSQWDGGMYTIRDQNIQVSPCSWLVHLWEILLPLMVGGTVILLHPGGHMDVAYLSETLSSQQVTTIIISPGIIRGLIHYVEDTQRTEIFRSVRRVYTGGNDRSSSCCEHRIFE